MTVFEPAEIGMRGNFMERQWLMAGETKLCSLGQPLVGGRSSARSCNKLVLVECGLMGQKEAPRAAESLFVQVPWASWVWTRWEDGSGALEQNATLPPPSPLQLPADLWGWALASPATAQVASPAPAGGRECRAMLFPEDRTICASPKEEGRGPRLQ